MCIPLLSACQLTSSILGEDVSSQDPDTSPDPGSPTPTIPTPVPFKVITDEMSTCILEDGDLTCWGENAHYEKLDGTTINVLVPTAITAVSGVESFDHGFDFTCAVINGGVKCWGLNGLGQLGNGTTIASGTPVDVTGLTSGVSKVVAGQRHACALLTDGSVKCWGDNNAGELGRGFTDAGGGYRSTADFVSGLTSGVVDDIFAGPIKAEHTCALIGGGIKCWGYNAFRQLGDGTTVSKNVPTDVLTLGAGSGVAQVAVSRYQTCALLDTGVVKCWGMNDFGQLGNNNLNVHSATPVTTSLAALQVGETVISIGAGEDQACLLTDLGAVYCWGRRNFGQLGDGVLSGASVTAPALSLITSGAEELSVGRYHNCVKMDNDDVKCWGNNNFGQLGQGTSGAGTHTATPVLVTF